MHPRRFLTLVSMALVLNGSLAWSSAGSSWGRIKTGEPAAAKIVTSPKATCDGRRAFLATATGAFLSAAIGSTPAFAEGDAVDDLAMPTEAELKAKEEDEMAARLKRKAELQKKASRPISFTDSLRGEKEKQKSLEKSKAERRNALCEELGRGC